MIKMKALRSFGVPGANEGKVKRGREFAAANPHRARELEEHGLAYPIAVPPLAPEPRNQMLPVHNEAAATGPFVSPGGAIGADAPAPSSPPDRPRRRRRSARSSGEDLLS
jgi:hypothetical protein